jgi:hypothetical protein
LRSLKPLTQPKSHLVFLLISVYPEIFDFWMKQSAVSGQQSAKDVDILRFLLKAESYVLIALIRKWVFPDEN